MSTVKANTASSVDHCLQWCCALFPIAFGATVIVIFARELLFLSTSRRLLFLFSMGFIYQLFSIYLAYVFYINILFYCYLPFVSGKLFHCHVNRSYCCNFFFFEKIIVVTNLPNYGIMLQCKCLPPKV